MSESARVRSLSALAELRGALLKFRERAGALLASVDADLARAGHTFTHERPAYWQGQMRKAEDARHRLRAEIARKELIAAPNPASTVVEKRDLDRATRRLDVCRQKLEVTRHWAREWEKQALMIRGSMQPMSAWLGRESLAGAARLERQTLTLEEYLAGRPPESASPATGGAPSEPSARDPDATPGADGSEPGQ